MVNCICGVKQKRRQLWSGGGIIRGNFIFVFPAARARHLIKGRWSSSILRRGRDLGRSGKNKWMAGGKRGRKDGPCWTIPSLMEKMQFRAELLSSSTRHQDCLFDQGPFRLPLAGALFVHTKFYWCVKRFLVAGKFPRFHITVQHDHKA